MEKRVESPIYQDKEVSKLDDDCFNEYFINVLQNKMYTLRLLPPSPFVGGGNNHMSDHINIICLIRLLMVFGGGLQFQKI